MIAMMMYLSCLLAAGLGADPAPLAGAVIVVDPGHGGQRYSKSYTAGTRGKPSGLTESELNLRVAFELAKCLREKGATVYMTREGDRRLSREGSDGKAELHARIDFFEHYNVHFFMSVHHNADGAKASGHSVLYKHNAKDDTLYKAFATDVNDALTGAVPGPKNPLIVKSIHILRETDIPGELSEAGFMTNPSYDELSNRPDYPPREAAALCKGAIKFWQEHKSELVELRDKLAKERAAHPRNPNTYTATDLNPAYQEHMKKLLAQVAPEGKYDPAKVGEYLENFKKAVVTDPKANFTVTATYDGKRIKLGGETSIRAYHDQLIDMLVAMKLYDISNAVRVVKLDDKPPNDGYVDVDLPRIPRLIAKEPKYVAEPRYALIVFDPAGRFRCWAVLDKSRVDLPYYDVLYFDVNGNGDMTELGKRFTGKFDPAAKALHIDVGDLAVPGTTLRHSALRFATVEPHGYPGYWFSMKWAGETPVDGGYGPGGERLTAYAATPAAAPVLRPTPLGPLAFACWTTELSIGRSKTIQVSVGNAGSGNDTFCALSEHFLTPGKDTIVATLLAKDRDGKDLRVKTDLKKHCCGILYHDVVGVPANAAPGNALLRLELKSEIGHAAKPAEIPVMLK
jgi:N-acetylmuramoyl-L-alanine amidase